MAAAVNGNERNPSYDCQWMFDLIGSAVLEVGKKVKWSIIVIPSGVKDPIGNLFQSVRSSQVVSLMRAYTPEIISEGLCSFGEGIVRDVKWLFNEPAKEDFGFGSDLEEGVNQAELNNKVLIQTELERLQVKLRFIESIEESTNNSNQPSSGSEGKVGQARGAIFQKSEVLAAIRKCEFNTAEARRCAQRVALVVVGLLLYIPVIAYTLKK